MLSYVHGKVTTLMNSDKAQLPTKCLHKTEARIISHREGGACAPPPQGELQVVRKVIFFTATVTGEVAMLQ